MSALVFKVGDVFGAWEIVGSEPQKKAGGLAWLCECHGVDGAGCGNRQFVVGSRLRRGLSTSCTSCASKRSARMRMSVTVNPGERFGNWEVIEEGPRSKVTGRSGGRRTVWCVCRGPHCNGTKALLGLVAVRGGNSGGCRTCVGKTQIRHVAEGTEFSGFRVVDGVKDEEGKVGCECTRCGTVFRKDWSRILRGSLGCPGCYRRKHMFLRGGKPVRVEDLATSVTVDVIRSRLKSLGLKPGDEIPDDVIFDTHDPTYTVDGVSVKLADLVNDNVGLSALKMRLRKEGLKAGDEIPLRVLRKNWKASNVKGGR